MDSTKSGLLGILGLIVGILLIFGVLNYFNILSLSRIYPNLFGSLPHKSLSTAQTTVPKEPVTIGCPVEENFCKNAQILYFPHTKAYQGLGWNLPKGSPIKAVFDGKLSKDDISGPRGYFRAVLLRSNDGKYEARYIFIPNNQTISGEELKKFQAGVSVRKGDVLDQVSDKYLQNFGFPNISLQFYIVEKMKNVSLNLKPGDLNNKKLSL